MRPVVLFGVSAVAICLFLTTHVQADPILVTTGVQADPAFQGHQGFNTFNPTITDTSDVATATTFSIPNFTSTFAQDGVFLGMPSQNVGTVTLNVANPTAFTLSNSVFGTFTGIGILADTTSPVGRLISLFGDFMPGSYPISQGAPPGTFLSDFNFAFSQVLASGPISASATFGTPSVVPEPSSIFLLLPSVAAVVRFRLRRGRPSVSRAE